MKYIATSRPAADFRFFLLENSQEDSTPSSTPERRECCSARARALRARRLHWGHALRRLAVIGKRSAPCRRRLRRSPDRSMLLWCCGPDRQDRRAPAQSGRALKTREIRVAKVGVSPVVRTEPDRNASRSGQRDFRTPPSRFEAVAAKGASAVKRRQRRAWAGLARLPRMQILRATATPRVLRDPPQPTRPSYRAYREMPARRVSERDHQEASKMRAPFRGTTARIQEARSNARGRAGGAAGAEAAAIGASGLQLLALFRDGHLWDCERNDPLPALARNDRATGRLGHRHPRPQKAFFRSRRSQGSRTDGPEPACVRRKAPPREDPIEASSRPLP